MTFNDLIQHRWLTLALRYVLGFIFVYAAIEKIAVPEEFAKTILNYRILPLAAVNMFAVVLPWVELLAGLGLIAGISVRSNAAIILGMLIVFSIAIAIALVRGLDISCGCFGTASAAKVGWSRLGEDIAMIIGAWIVLSAHHKKTTPPQQ
jgi:uncharacterized membrane protein YphA (DoxX/SURF4 family)